VITIVSIGLLVGFREPVLAGIGRWLVVESVFGEADLVVALGGDRGRQEAAAELLERGRARWIMFVGSDVRLRDYRCLDITPDRAIPPPPPAYTTYEEAVATRTIAEKRGFKSIIVVTSPYHLRRTRWTFEKLLSDKGIVAAVHPAPDGGFAVDTWWRSHLGRKMVIMEYLGLAYYWLTV
jgi:hypothetical protein